METVYTTNGGHRFHANEACKNLYSGQVLYGGWGDLRVHRIEQTTIVEAMGRGREACAVCFPGLRAAWYRGNSENDYGHVPHDEYEGSDGPEAYRLVCARCIRWVRWAEVDISVGYRISWPCTSAIVLGLVPREQEAA